MEPFLGPPVERLESGGTHFFQDVYFGKGTLPTKKGEKGHLAGGPSLSTQPQKVPESPWGIRTVEFVSNRGHPTMGGVPFVSQTQTPGVLLLTL